MTTPQNDRYKRNVAAGGETIFDYDFQIFEEEDIAVYRERAGTVTKLVLTTDYTVTGVGVQAGGTIVVNVAAVADDIYAILGVNEYRSADYSQPGDFLAADVNNDMNKQMQTSQQCRRDIDRTFKLQPTDEAIDLTLALPDERAGKLMGFDNDGAFELKTSPIHIEGTANEIDILEELDTFTIGLTDNPVIPGSASMRVPIGATGSRPGAPVNGDFRYNSSLSTFEGYVNGDWQNVLDTSTGAPISASYIVQTSDGVLTNEQALADLNTGLLKNTTATGVLTIATQGTDYYAPGGTDVAVADGGTGASTAANARTNLGLVIGTDVQAYDDTLQSISALGTAADKMLYTTGVDTWAEADITAAGRAILDDADAAAQRTTLGLGTIATQAASNVTITGGAITGITDLAIADGGTGASTKTAAFDALSPTTTKGDLIVSDGTNNIRLAVGMDAYVLTADSTQASGLKWEAAGGAGTGDVTGPVSSVDSEIALFSGTGGKTIKRATGTGIAKLTSGVLSTATAGTDYYSPGGTAVAVADGGTGVSSLTAYAPIFGGTSGTGAVQSGTVGTSGHVLTSNGAGALPTFQAPAGGTAATQAEQKIATSTSVFVSPGRQQFHPSASKAWLYMKYSGGTPQLTASYNITSITDNGTGDATIVITTGFSSANYAVAMMGEQGSGTERCVWQAHFTSPRTAGTLRVLSEAGGSLGVDRSGSFIMFGDQ